MLRRLNVSDAAAKIATSLTPAASARSRPARLGTSALYRTPGFRVMPANTSAASPICGTHFGDTNAETSMRECPAAVNRSTNAIFAAAGTTACSFCSPSRGPTSTTLTRVGRDAVRGAASLESLKAGNFAIRVKLFDRPSRTLAPRSGARPTLRERGAAEPSRYSRRSEAQPREQSCQVQQVDAWGHEISGLAVDRRDDAVARRANRQLHLHGFEREEDIAARDWSAGCDEKAHDGGWHR